MQLPLPLDEQLCFSLYAASIAVNRIYKPVLDDLGLTYPQFLVLQVLHEQDGFTVSAIADRLWLPPSTITPIVKRLEAGGFVRRVRDSRDEREIHVHMTKAGLALWARTGCLSDVILQRARMTMVELAALNSKVRALRDALATSEAGS